MWLQPGHPWKMSDTDDLDQDIVLLELVSETVATSSPTSRTSTVPFRGTKNPTFTQQESLCKNLDNETHKDVTNDKKIEKKSQNLGKRNKCTVKEKELILDHHLSGKWFISGKYSRESDSKEFFFNRIKKIMNIRGPVLKKGETLIIRVVVQFPKTFKPLLAISTVRLKDKLKPKIFELKIYGTGEIVKFYFIPAENTSANGRPKSKAIEHYLNFTWLDKNGRIYSSAKSEIFFWKGRNNSNRQKSPKKVKKIDENAQKSNLVINDISCDAGSGDCLYTPTPNSPCYDNDTSTVNDVCDSEGECSGSSLNCIVGNVCVDGFSTNNISFCNGGDACTENDQCVDDKCQPPYVESDCSLYLEENIEVMLNEPINWANLFGSNT